MKKLYFIISLLFVLCSLYSQEKSQNYILTRSMLNEWGTQYVDDIQYLDGLGRPFMNVQKSVTPGRSNLITLQEYDGFGRESKVWLPDISTSDYSDPVSLKSAVISAYNNDNRPYNEIVYENSPLSRILTRYGPGANWENHPVSTSYLTNGSSIELSCRYYYVSSAGILMQSGTYSAGELYVEKSTDEDDHVFYSFKDKLGRQILSRQMLGADPHDTYYVYDDFNNLCFVLPPAYKDTPSLASFAYRYKYDERNRCIEKTLPGCKPIKYVYDKADNLIFSQDGIQRSKGEWTFYLYDVFQRLVMRGVCNNTDTSSANGVIVKTTLSRNSSTRAILPTGIGDTGYSSSFAITSPIVHVVNYYDDYTFSNIDGFSDKTSRRVNVAGMLTGNITYLFNEYRKYCTVTHYDQMGRVVKVIADNDMSGLETTTTTYTFSGKPLTVQHVHTALGHPDQSETYCYVYDHAERLTKVTHQLAGKPLVVLSQTEYDDLGRVKTKTLHGNDKLKTSYSYNIRNWMTGISGNVFKENLYYNTGSGSALYNGNISSMEWRFGSSALESYRFSYDGLNRLLSADYRPGSWGQLTAPNYSERVLEYDKQGNILRIQRYGQSHTNNLMTTPPMYDILDNLTMTYNGNQLMKVSDSGRDPLTLGSFNYVDLNGDGSSDFSYDANGNLIKDLDKEITDISYNCLNLPDKVVFADNGGTREILYEYDAGGMKRSVTHVTSTGFIISPISSLPILGGGIGGGVGSQTKKYFYTTTYCGNVIYKQTITENGGLMNLLKNGLDRILTEEGYITFNGTTPEYHYFVKDHLGNVRVVMNQDGTTVEQTNSYYPFGGVFSSTGSDNQPYKFGGKEFDGMHGLDWCDFGKRHLRNDAPRWMSIDPLCEKYYSISPYAYCLNNPIKYIDLDGLYPRSVLVYDAKLGLYGGYRFTQSAAYLLSLVSGVSRLYIDNTVIQERAVGQYRPWYSANKGGGAITLGTDAFNSNITYTENFFSDDPNSYNGNGYGQDVMAWLSLSSHEVGHLPQIDKAGGMLNYLVSFAVEYAKSGHDAAASEIEADKGYKVFNEFNFFVNKTYGYSSIEKLFNSNVRENRKVETITKWWNVYQNVRKKQTKSFLNNFQNLEEGTYKWNGNTWEKQ